MDTGLSEKTFILKYEKYLFIGVTVEVQLAHQTSEAEVKVQIRHLPQRS